MKIPQNLRYLFIGFLWLLSSFTYTVAQDNGVNLKNLPPCSVPCADAAASAVDCDKNNISCLCSHQRFTTATIQCARANCQPDAFSFTNEVLTEMCADASTTSTSSTTSSTSTSTSTSASSTTTTSSTTSTSTSSSSQSTRTSTTLVSTTLPTSLSQSTTQSASSTVVVVQTVVVEPASTTLSAAGKLDIGSTSTALTALIFGLLPLIWVVAAI